MAHRGTTLVLLLSALLAGCPAENGTADAGAGADAHIQSRDAQTVSLEDGGSGGACSLNQDCMLVAKHCCGPCEPTASALRAVPVNSQYAPEVCTDVLCGACPEPEWDVLHTQLRAGCVSGQCAVVDLRSGAATACENDGECELRGASCCGGCGGQASGWLALRKGAEDPTALECDPLPPCLPCTETAQPTAYCAADKHCAVRDAATVQGAPSSTCYSPFQRLEHSYDDGAVGCDCRPEGDSMCRADSTGRNVALVCNDGHWVAIEDGCGLPGE